MTGKSQGKVSSSEYDVADPAAFHTACMRMNAAGYSYDSSFMNLAARVRGSARIIVDLLRSALPVSSVADFGYALGTWLVGVAGRWH